MAAQGFGFPISIVLVFVVVLGVILGFAIKLCADDARRRGKSPLLVSIACIFFFPWGLVAWLMFRPQPIAPKSAGNLHLDDYRLQ